MLFSSATFLFVFLPLVLALHALAPRSARNALLLAASLLFYGWGEGLVVLALVGSIAANFALGLAIARSVRHARAWLVVAIVSNLGLLGCFKYATFATTSANELLAALGVPALPVVTIALPAGISFFTFQAISYVVDVARRHTTAETHLGRFALYITMFPQLVAGPIVRYTNVRDQLRERHVDLEDFAAGVRRFLIGLGKKVLLADTLGRPVDAIFALPANELTPALAWCGTLCFGLQVYHDFSGYTDMAIGLGRMFGFGFPENFRYPYVARSMRELWQRWHITVSTWFRDYLFVVLPGGARRLPKALDAPAPRPDAMQSRAGEFAGAADSGAVRRNLLIVFLLVGLWHGANWHFVAWGAFHGCCIVLERAWLAARLERLPRWCGHLYLHVVLAIHWPLFRCTSLAHAGDYYGALLGLGETASPHSVASYASNEVLLCVVLAALGCTPWLAALRRSWPAPPALVVTLARTVATLAFLVLLVACSAKVAAEAHVPFLYFRF